MMLALMRFRGKLPTLTELTKIKKTKLQAK